VKNNGGIMGWMGVMEITLVRRVVRWQTHPNVCLEGKNWSVGQKGRMRQKGRSALAPARCQVAENSPLEISRHLPMDSGQLNSTLGIVWETSVATGFLHHSSVDCWHNEQTITWRGCGVFNRRRTLMSADKDGGGASVPASRASPPDEDAHASCSPGSRRRSPHRAGHTVQERIIRPEGSEHYFASSSSRLGRGGYFFCGRV